MNRIILLPVNYFPNRECNYACEFCFHTALSSHIETLDKVKRGLRLVAETGMKKIDMSGGEPSLTSKLIEEIIKFCKADIELESTGTICKGSKATKKWLVKYGPYVDMCPHSKG